MIFIGIDNGISGSIGIVRDRNDIEKENKFFAMPIKEELNYTKTSKMLHRINTDVLKTLLQPYSQDCTIVALERPMVNPRRFFATTSALRALEATLIVIEQLKMPYEYIDSKEWQKVLLPKKLKKEKLKFASLQVGKRLFPTLDFEGFSDCDGLLIAEYLRRKNMKEKSNIDFRADNSRSCGML